MEDVKETLKPVKWTESVKSIGKQYSIFPLIAKPTRNTANLYRISEDPVLLHHVWYTRRLVAQNLEDEGAYVVGPLLDIPAEYSGTFQYLPNQKGYAEVYSSVKEIAQSLPERVYVQENLLVYPIYEHEVTQDKVKSVLLPALTQLSIIEKINITTVMPSSKFAFGVKSRLKSMVVACVSFRNEATKEVLNIPLTTRGRFSTILNIPRHGRELDFRDVVNELDLPINLITCANCPQTLLDEHFLRSGMRLRATAIEDHEIIIGVTISQTIVEFAAEGVEFILPQHLDGIESREQEIAYQTSLQRFLMECQIKNSPVNVRDYKRSIRTHVARNIRLTKPKAISPVASSRPRVVSRPPSNSDVSAAGVSAIQLLSVSGNGMDRSHFRRSSASRQSSQQRSQRLMLPASHDSQGEVPPLPPRNSLRLRNISPKRRTARAASYHCGDNFDFPPAPLPPTSQNPKPFVRPGYREVWGSIAHAELSTEKHHSSSLLDEELAATSSHKDRTGILPDCKPSNHATPPASPRPLIFSSECDRHTGEPVEECVPKMLCEVAALNTKYENKEDESRQPNTYTSDSGVQNINGSDASPSHLSPVRMVASKALQTDLNTDELNPDIPPITDISLTGISSNDEEQVTAPDCGSVTDARSQMPDPDAGKGSSASDDNAKDMDAFSISSEEQRSEQSNDLVSLQMTKLVPDSSPSSEPKPIQQSNLHICQHSVATDDSNSLPSSPVWNYASSPQGWKPPADLSEMSVKEVADSLRYIGMTEATVEWFRAEKVDGHLLCGIEKDLLAQHFRLTSFQQRKIAMFVQGWRPKI